MKKNILTKALCAALMVSLTVSNFTAIAAQDVLPKLETREEVYVGAGEGGPEITPYFSSVGHVDRQCAYVVSHLNLNAQQRAVMEKAARDADSLYGGVRGFHARKNKDGSSNYLANLKALEICGVRIDKEPNLKSYVLGRMPNISAKDKDDVGKMIDATLSYVNDKAKNYTREQKRYAIAGFGIHLLGDMFAHRAMIKKVWLSNWGSTDTTTNKYFQTSDFKPDRLEEFKAKIREGKLCTVDMKPYMKDTVTGYFYHERRKEWVQAQTKGQLYIDNIHFMPGRIKAAERAAASFVETVFVTGIGFPDINYYLKEYNLDLENFAQYKAAL